ncbi:cobalt-precorrin 5A acetaldehyde-lyase [Stanieria cyanosphaera PCC 7437]|uniref:Cobalt-precorrin 5A acetaldehyde-lyase n=1 Tax=Stanieria cyanosphaera (strain ATCC 29371 / PCC 7437) TaxID=111780 RepID=K9XYL4_STAC7|nr:precorrin-3B C(17)-methyltransferase [Stanieria cyanosphaera]AFZ36772.1 cobalt-precorrin 5A acetaldehyde-lyase [Stanieria cyanosphaera PCC 7437]
MNNSCFSQFQPLAAIATTPQSASILQHLHSNLELELWLPQSLEGTENTRFYQTNLSEHLTNIWHEYRAFVFCLATGAVVRLIAPLIESKATDPAVVVIDAQGRFVISLCSGHQGGADLLAQLIAQQIGAQSIITGASDSLRLPKIDLLGLPYGWRKGDGDWTGVMAAIAKNQTVQIIQEVGSTLWQQNLPDGHPFYFGFPEANQQFQPQGRIWISATQRRFASNSDFPKVQWHPRVLWIGIGCERGTSAQLIETAITDTLQKYHLSSKAIAGIATIDLKADEVGILELCQSWNLPLRTFSAQQLSPIDIPNPSEIVQQEVGTPSVAEAAAILASNTDNSLIVAKQIIKLPHQSGAVTVAIAQPEQEYIGRQGKLYLVGIGPGSLEQITPAAKTAIIQADVVIGYSLYLDLIKPLLRPEQIIESFPITQEKQRAQRSRELAQWGLTVAVISSGDCGIYGMAGLVLEELQAEDWDGKNPVVEVFPGISALQAAAARVGAPLMHDFCAISLSDLLTPWQVIQKRLEAAAQGDFVTAIYNPRSQKRTQQIVTAQEIFLKYRRNDTPVALVSSAYRLNETINITTLKEMLKHPIDMLTIIIIGNSSTRRHTDWVITPRGYLGFDG